MFICIQNLDKLSPLVLKILSGNEMVTDLRNRVQAGSEFQGEVTSPSRNFREKFAYPREK